MKPVAGIVVLMVVVVSLVMAGLLFQTAPTPDSFEIVVGVVTTSDNPSALPAIKSYTIQPSRVPAEPTGWSMELSAAQAGNYMIDWSIVCGGSLHKTVGSGSATLALTTSLQWYTVSMSSDDPDYDSTTLGCTFSVDQYAGPTVYYNWGSTAVGLGPSFVIWAKKPDTPTTPITPGPTEPDKDETPDTYDCDADGIADSQEPCEATQGGTDDMCSLYLILGAVVAIIVVLIIIIRKR